MSVCDPVTKSMRVLMLPDYRIDNPYQKLLSQSLESQKILVFFPIGYRRVLPIYRAIKKQKKIDILHLHWLSPYLKGKNIFVKSIYALKFIIDIFLVKISGVKIVWTIHNYVSHDSQFPRLEKWVQGNLLSLVNRVIVHDSLAVKYFQSNYQADNSIIHIIPHGHYREVYHPAISLIDARKTLGIPIVGKVYLFFGMLRPYKGLERLLKIWNEHIKFFQDCYLLIAGKAFDESYFKKLNQLATGMQKVILHNEFIEDSKIHLFFSAADVAVFPFEKVLTSGSLILAMSYNKPIIAPRVGGISQTLGKADWLLYDSQDTQGLWKSLHASTQIDLGRLSKIVNHECDKLSWHDIGFKTSVVYNHLLHID